MKLADFSLPVCSGLLLTASFPRSGIPEIAWVALIPLLVSVYGTTGFTAFQRGWIAGLVHYISLTYWLVHTLVEFGNIPLAAAWGILVLFAAYLALFPALFAVSAFYLLQSRMIGCVAIPSAWVGLEYIRSFFLTGFPWELLGNSQFNRLELIQIADITGVYGISFLIASVNVALFGGISWISSRISGKLPCRFPLVFLALFTSTLLMMAIGYGVWRMNSVRQMADTTASIRLAVVQGNINQADKWNPEKQVATLEKYFSLSRASGSHPPELIIWPETAAPFYFGHHAELTEMVREGVRNIGSAFLIGSPFAQPEKQKFRYYNSAFLISPDGRVAGRYDKTHLVPFGEYVPLQQWLPFIHKMVEAVGDFERGTPGHTLALSSRSLGVLICYEQIFPYLSRRLAQNGAELLVSMTNDAWYGNTAAPYQHFSMAVFRAVETRRSLARSANTGISGFIDPTGHIVSSTKIFTDAVCTESMPLMTVSTIYTRYGDVFAVFCLTASILSLVLNQLNYPLHQRRFP